jgi:hypothetical protein
MDRTPTIETLAAAINLRTPPEGVMHHSGKRGQAFSNQSRIFLNPHMVAPVSLMM